MKYLATKHGVDPIKDQNFMLPPALNDLLIEAFQSLQPQTRRETYLRDEVLRKYISEETASSDVRSERALAKWLAAESKNRLTNERFDTYLNGNVPSGINLGYCKLKREGIPFHSIVQLAQKRIATILGETIPVEALLGSFSGGATSSRRRTESNPALKYAGKAHITAQALPWMQLAWSETPGWNPHWYLLDLMEVEANVMFTVPKDSEIDRIAAKEPDLNMWLQKGAGQYIRSRLRRFGIDLNDQSVNRRLARVGSCDGSYATLDLSSASDSICTSVVELLLPHQWYNLLYDLRSPKTVLLDGETHVNEMFSSMGNGFTFELESLIFYSLVWAVHRSLMSVRGYREKVVGLRLSVYGDDIICPTLMAESLIDVLHWFGFTVNESKSFYNTTPPFFRESCGGHYQDDENITPFYLKAPVRKLTDLIHCLNKIRHWSRVSWNTESYVFASCRRVSYLDSFLAEIWAFFSDYVPQDLRGGYDYTKKTQLVTRESSQKELIEITEKRRVTTTSAYLCWLNATWSRNSVGDGTSVSTLAENTGIFRKRKVPWVYSGLSHSVPIYWGEMLSVEGVS